MTSSAEKTAAAPSTPRLLSGGWAYLVYALIVAAQTVLVLDLRALWFSDEVRYATALVEMMRGDNWLTLTLNGVPYPDKPPVYFWLLALVAWIGGSTDAWVMLAGSAIGGFAFVAAGHFLVRRVAPARPEAALATGLLLLGTPYVAFLFHYVRMDLLFAAAIVAAFACAHTGLRRPSVSRWMVAAFALMTLASFIKGPLGHALPMLALAVDAGVTRRLRRLVAWDVAIGIVLSLGVAAAWFGAVVATKGWSFVETVLDEQILQRAVDAWHHGHPMWFYLPLIPIIWLPWTLLPALGPVRRAIGRGVRAVVRRAADDVPGAVPGAVFVAGFVLLSLLSGKIHIYLLPILAPLAAVTAVMLVDMPAARRVWAWRMAAAVHAAVGVAMLVEVIGGFAPFAIGGLLPLAVVELAGAAALAWAAGSRHAFVPLWANVALITVAMNGLNLWVAPSLDTVLSPKAQAEAMRDFDAQGYDVIAFGTYDGVYTYYFGGVVDELDDPAALEARLATGGPVAVAMRESTYDNLGALVADLEVVQRVRIAENVYVLLVQTPPGDRARPTSAEPDSGVR